LDNPFEFYYFTDSVGELFQNLYENKEHMQDHFIDYWKQVVTYFKDEPNVLGYELLNEPFAEESLIDYTLQISNGKSDE